MDHRREIDGLRAIAVLAVLGSHAGLPGFSGGFVGVDVFFVISGFLITGLVLSELTEGRFSLVGFYERRARRILPALFLVMVACLAVGWPLMGADAYQNLGQSVVATTLFANNLLLMVTTGYWELAASFKPLLHTWSLGVEEQYYLLAPLILIAASRWSRDRLRLLLMVLGLASFLVCLWTARQAPIANFYMLHTRVWELAVGGWLAAGPSGTARRGNDPLALLGLGLITGAVVLLPAASPSWTTAPAVLGAALVLTYGQQGLSYGLLSSRPMVGLGLISYSLYLWHQPLFTFLRVAGPVEPPPWQYGLMILVLLPVAWMSWRFVEQPFRNRARISGRRLAAILGSAAVVLVVAGGAIHLGGGLPWRFDRVPGDGSPGGFKAYNQAVFRFKRDAFSSDSRPGLLVVGNSVARDLVNMAVETHRFDGYEIIYRDDIDFCFPDGRRPPADSLTAEAALVVLVGGWGVAPPCTGRALAASQALQGKVLFVGPRDFGRNLNPYARLPLDKRRGAMVQVSDPVLRLQARLMASAPPDLYVNVIARLSPDGRHLPIFDEEGRILSEDGLHLTRAGALFVGQRVFSDPVWSRVEATSRSDVH